MNMQENIQGVKINLTRGHDVDHTKTIASFFSGYGGLEMGIKSALGGKCRTIVFVEREAFAVANLVAKIEAGLLDAAPIYTDVTTFPYGKFRGLVDIACGGVPCQPHSVAGKRKGGNDERFLFDIFFDGLQEMQSRQIFIENVEGLLTSRMPDGYLCFKYIVERLEKMDYRVKAGLFTAAEVGAPHRRKRVFILANARCFRQEIGQVQTAGIVESGELVNTESRSNGQQQTEQQGRNTTWRPSEEEDVANTKSQRERARCGEVHQADGEIPERNDHAKFEQSGKVSMEIPGRIGRGGRSEGGPEVRECGLPEDKASESGASSEVLGNASSVRSCGMCENAGTVGADEDGEERRLCQSQGAGTLSRNGSQEILANSNIIRPQGKRSDSNTIGREGQSERQIGLCNGTRWPSRPGQPQYDWEEPRITQPGLGRKSPRNSFRVDRLRLLGNGVVPQQAARAWTILNEEMNK